MGAPNPDVTALVNQLALQYWTVANTPNLSGVIAAVTAQLSRLGGEINSAVVAFAQAQVTAVFTAQEATESAHGGPAAGGTITLGAFGSAPAAEGASVSGSVLTMQPADATHPGEVSIAAQSFAGLKTLVNDGALGTGAVSAAASTLRTTSAGYNRTTAQTLARNTRVIMDFNVSEFDTDSAVTTGAAWHFTVPAGKGGLYYLAANVAVVCLSTTSRLIGEFFRNGANYKRVCDVVVIFASDNNPSCAGSTICQLAAGDTVDFRVFAADTTTDPTTNVGEAFAVWVNITRIPGS